MTLKRELEMKKKMLRDFSDNSDRLQRLLDDANAYIEELEDELNPLKICLETYFEDGTINKKEFMERLNNIPYEIKS